MTPMSSRGIALLSNERKSCRPTSRVAAPIDCCAVVPLNARRNQKYERRCTKNADSCRGVPNLYLNALVETVFSPRHRGSRCKRTARVFLGVSTFSLRQKQIPPRAASVLPAQATGEATGAPSERGPPCSSRPRSSRTGAPITTIDGYIFRHYLSLDALRRRPRATLLESWALTMTALLQLVAVAVHIIDRRNWASALIRLHVERRITP